MDPGGYLFKYFPMLAVNGLQGQEETIVPQMKDAGNKTDISGAPDIKGIVAIQVSMNCVRVVFAGCMVRKGEITDGNRKSMGLQAGIQDIRKNKRKKIRNIF